MSDDLIKKSDEVLNPHNLTPSDEKKFGTVIRELVAEVKRIRADNDRAERAHESLDAIRRNQLAAKDSLNNDLMANCNQLRDRCWKAESEVERLLEEDKMNDLQIHNMDLQLIDKDIELTRWKEIAIDERAKYNASTHVAALCVHPDAIMGMMKTIDDHIEEFRPNAAKELNLQIGQEAGYLKRLEVEYLTTKAELILHEEAIYVDGEQNMKAQSALAKIREGKP